MAQSNALVTVRQGSNIIYQTTVPPGPFTLQDVYPSGYGSDLEVSVKEADGSVEVFSVPYASVAQLLRPGMTRYALSAGKVDEQRAAQQADALSGDLAARDQQPVDRLHRGHRF